MIQANALHIPLRDESVQCVVTSPPYWWLRDYGTATWEGGKNGCDHRVGGQVQDNKAKGAIVSGVRPGVDASICLDCGAKRIDNQLGLEKTPEEYVENTVKWAREVWRVLRPDGCFWLNLGDSYAGSWGAMSHDMNGKAKRSGSNERPPQSFVKSKRMPRGSGRWGGGNLPATGHLKPKDLCEIPSDVVRALRADGWWLRSRLPWVKRSSMPESCTDRPASALEYMFLLTKSGTSQYWTHRDFSGVREIPKPDWRWQNQAEELELDKPPDGWVDSLILCQVCDGTGYENRFENTDLFGETQMTWGSICENCKDTEYIIDDLRFIKEWKRINLWQGHDYYFDMDAIRKPQSLNTHERFGKNPRPAGRRKMAESGSGIKTNESFDAAIKTMILPNGRNFRNTDLFYQSLEEPHGAIFCGDEMVGLDVNPQAYSEAHFATFPEWLVTPLIKAGTSEKGACPECGAPWERVVDREPGFDVRREYEQGQRGRRMGAALDSDYRGVGITRQKTIGWQPTCKCYGENEKEIACFKCGFVLYSYYGRTKHNELRVVQGRVHAPNSEGSSKKILQQEMCVDMGNKEQVEQQGLVQKLSRVHSDKQPESSERIKGGICDGTQACDGEENRETSSADGSGSSYKQKERRQSSGKSKTNAEKGSRQDEESKIHGDLPMLSKGISIEGECQSCGQEIIRPSIVLDIFGGSGTTKKVADRLGRRGVICELKMEYIDMAKKRCHKEPSLF